ncbi:hypothetical protein JP09_008140 [Dehalogenimonas etheniformans]|uniref:Uncharacterized protein n=1 Tax=Dehalogenimonas etheniformans TaxID=1536648 RepID=A0A2P5P5Z2_9CHLR|nr:hypothetical protein JP09_008140 [Dehalogenimonas etheniformans]
MLLRILGVVILVFAIPVAAFSIMGLIFSGDSAELIQGVIGTVITVGLVLIGYMLVKRSFK